MNNEVRYNRLYAISIPIKLAQELNDVIQPHNPVPIPMNMFLSGLTLRLCDNKTFDTPSIELKCELSYNIPSNYVNNSITNYY